MVMRPLARALLWRFIVATNSSVLKINAVSKQFGGKLALDNLSLSLQRGEVYALLGPNGAGKTTTLNLILGFITPDSGSIEISGARVDRDPYVARTRIAYLPETVMLHPGMSAIENLEYFALLGGRRLSASEASSLLTEAGLAVAVHGKRTAGFSKGMRQKVGLAIALAKHAELLLLDEPTSGLDASAANEFSTLVRAASARNIAVLMATHDLYRVKDVAHRLGILRNGCLVAERETAGLNSAAIELLYLEQLAA
ncbi:MAG TPA: ABC transporter ATP-binding protein [Dongiaceae bacterium]|nr:ABC transporter ATP-binding protein [Dongiaceae bacterium]